MIIAVCNDGILVSDKKRSDYMKSYVEKICGQPRYVDTLWDNYRVIDINNSIDGSIILTPSLIVKAKTTMTVVEIQSGIEISKEDKEF